MRQFRYVPRLRRARKGVQRRGEPAEGADAIVMSITKPKNAEYLIAILILSLSLFGCLMVYSSSSHYAEQNLGDSMFFFKRQLLWFIIALACGFGAYLIGYKRMLKYSSYLLGISVLLLLVVLFTEPVRNVHRWLRIGPFNFQPSEMAKIALILFTASALAQLSNQIRDWKSYISITTVAAIVCGLVLIEPDIGSTLTLSASIGMMLYVAGAKGRHLLTAISGGSGIIALMIFGFGYEKDRILDWIVGLLNPFNSPYQVKQGLIAIGSGGITGSGLGSGGQKLLFLPEPHSDFIYANIAEETGMMLTIPLLASFLFLFYLGVRVAMRIEEKSGKLIAFGLISLISISALTNIGVVLGVLPVTGLPLPFISYGGSSMLFSMISIGIILSVIRESNTITNQEKYRFDRYSLRSRWYRRSHISGNSYRPQAYKRKT
ncbi:MAG: hypothetical protein GF315_06540 [candidate division Zixibacteria bacterium]|nr:hypothetical protein [candidate division Zixibacteria bacterium]